jgi:hemoglobin
VSSLYDRIGGEAGVQALLQSFYSRVLSDHELKPFFEKTSIEKLLRMQLEFFTSALDGPSASNGTNLSHAHAGRGITSHHFNVFCQHMLETLRQLDLEEKDILDVVHRVSVLKNDVTGEAY